MINVIDYCSTATITQPSVTVGPYTYDIRSGVAGILAPLTGWSKTASCTSTPITFTLLYNTNGNPASAIFSLTATNVQVFATSVSSLGYNQMRLVGSIGTYTSSNMVFDITLIDSCTSLTIT
jgi:hypothetical protein